MDDKTTKTEMTALGVALNVLRSKLTEVRPMTKQTFGPVVCGVSRTAVNDWELNRFRPHRLAREHILNFVRGKVEVGELAVQDLADIEEALADDQQA